MLGFHLATLSSQLGCQRRRLAAGCQLLRRTCDNPEVICRRRQAVPADASLEDLPPIGAKPMQRTAREEHSARQAPSDELLGSAELCRVVIIEGEGEARAGSVRWPCGQVLGGHDIADSAQDVELRAEHLERNGANHLMVRGSADPDSVEQQSQAVAAAGTDRKGDSVERFAPQHPLGGTAERDRHTAHHPTVTGTEPQPEQPETPQRRSSRCPGGLGSAVYHSRMLTDAGSLLDGSVLEAEVCVIGAGPAGITVAREVSAAGRDVLLLDSGGREPDKASRDLAAGERVGSPYFPLEETRQRAFGGTSHSWPWVEGWRARPLDPIDLEPGRGREVGWPISYDELAHYYPEAERRCGLHPAIRDATAVGTAERPLLDLPADLARTVAFRYSRTTFTAPQEVLGGVPVRVLLRATARALRRSASGRSRIGEVDVVGPGGRSITVRAGTVVLAAGGIENATLLLASDRDDPGGIGNGHDLVGRCFMERLTFRAGVIEPTREGAAAALGFYGIHRIDGLGVQGVVTVAEPLLTRHGLRNTVFFIEGRDAAAVSEGVRSVGALMHVRDRRPRPPHLGRHALTAVRDGPDVLSTALRRATRRRGGDGVLLLRAQAEPAPQLDSKVTLGRGRDVLGRRRARLDWRIDPADLASVAHAVELIGEAFAAAGLGTLQRRPPGAPPPLVEGAHHHLGTTRMHADARHGVVDSDCRVHGVENLYVAGSSVFPTAGYANPTLTIVALALRLGAHLSRA